MGILSRVLWILDEVACVHNEEGFNIFILMRMRREYYKIVDKVDRYLKQKNSEKTDSSR